MNWIILSVLSVATASVSRILQKVLLRGEKSNPYAFGFVFQTLIAGFFLTYVFLREREHVFNKVVGTLFALSGVLLLV